ncbi:lipopolysaccharide assembly protein LapA domain-containing protein [Thiohalospira sp.]|uniref:lipopolysaccharide assembly protein LapA domain-containing protein n=1 Tax=Thiohalospira sp. TaxID=3080549 RepID=UPI0039815BF5
MRNTKRVIGFVFLLVVALLVLAFVVQNVDSITVDYFFGEQEMPLAVALVATLIVGVVVGVLASLGWVWRLRRRLRALRREVDTSRKEVENLRSMPLKDSA